MLNIYNIKLILKQSLRYWKPSIMALLLLLRLPNLALFSQTPSQTPSQIPSQMPSQTPSQIPSQPSQPSQTSNALYILAISTINALSQEINSFIIFS
jgi:hypothetical protein